MFRCILLISTVLAIGMCGRYRGKGGGRGAPPEPPGRQPYPTYLRNVTEEARREYSAIGRNQNTTIAAQKQEIQQWGQKYGVLNKVIEFDANQTIFRKDLNQNVTEVISELAEGQNQLNKILNNENQTRAEQQQAITAFRNQSRNVYDTLTFVGGLFLPRKPNGKKYDGRGGHGKDGGGGSRGSGGRRGRRGPGSRGGSRGGHGRGQQVFQQELDSDSSETDEQQEGRFEGERGGPVEGPEDRLELGSSRREGSNGEFRPGQQIYRQVPGSDSRLDGGRGGPRRGPRGKPGEHQGTGSKGGHGSKGNNGTHGSSGSKGSKGAHGGQKPRGGHGSTGGQSSNGGSRPGQQVFQQVPDYNSVDTDGQED